MPSPKFTVPYEDEYERWLCASYDNRLLSDWLSRTRRVFKLVDLTQACGIDDVEIALLRSPDYKKMSSSVRSQLKKAGRMYVEFKGQRK